MAEKKAVKKETKTAKAAPYRAMGERLHALILRSAPALHATEAQLSAVVRKAAT